MNLPGRLGIIFAITLFFTSCGGGSSSSGSGIGGTGITLVQGNVSSVDGQLFVTINPEGSQQAVAMLTEWIIPLSYAQSGSQGLLTVSGGGQSTSVNSSGEFQLPGVTPSTHFVLTFVAAGNNTIPLGIGEVPKGATVTVKNIAIDTNDSSAKPAEIDVKEPVEMEDDVSEDDVSEDSGSNTKSESEDDISEGKAEDEEGSDDSIDDVSNDDEK
jgi:hypothetical protein